MTRLATNERKLQERYRSELAERREEQLQQQLRIFREGLMRRRYSDAEIEGWVNELEDRLRGKMPLRD